MGKMMFKLLIVALGACGMAQAASLYTESSLQSLADSIVFEFETALEKLIAHNEAQELINDLEKAAETEQVNDAFAQFEKEHQKNILDKDLGEAALQCLNGVHDNVQSFHDQTLNQIQLCAGKEAGIVEDIAGGFRHLFDAQEEDPEKFRQQTQDCLKLSLVEAKQCLDDVQERSLTVLKELEGVIEYMVEELNDVTVKVAICSLEHTEGFVDFLSLVDDKVSECRKLK